MVGRVRELINRGIDPERICVLSFTNVAANELKARIANEDIFAGTIHSLANKILNINGIDTSAYIEKEDFDKLLTKVLDIPYENLPQFEVLIVDEFQDTGKKEYNFLQYLDVPQVMAIGDPRQRIYGFANKNFDPIGNCIKSNIWKRYIITTNYRCPQNIIEYGENFIKDQDFTYGQLKKEIKKEVAPLKKNIIKPAAPKQLPLKADLSKKTLMNMMKEGYTTEEILSKQKDIDKENENIKELNIIEVEKYNEQLYNYKKEMKKVEAIEQKIKDKEKQHSHFTELGYIADNKLKIEDIIRLIKQKKDYSSWAILCRTNEMIKQVIEILKKEDIPCGTFKQADFSTETGGLDEAMEANRVKVLTIHSAKGLEFDNVAVILSCTPDQITSKETGRLCYVAATRARRQLYWGVFVPKAKRRKSRQSSSKLFFSNSKSW